MDSNNILYIDDYPLLFEVLKAEDRDDGTFAMPDFYDGTLRHIRYGDTCALGSFEMDAMESHSHSNTHSHSANPHDHYMAHQHNYWERWNSYELVSQGSFWGRARVDTTTTGGRDRNDKQTVVINNATITTDSGTGKQATETRMKNTAGQWYMLAKVTYTT